MDLFEIRLHIGELLCRQDLASCTLVCKSWNDSFLPLLYRSLVLVVDWDDDDDWEDVGSDSDHDDSDNDDKLNAVNDHQKDIPHYKDQLPSKVALEKYGHHTRHLSVNFTNWTVNPILVDLAAAVHNLRSMFIRQSYEIHLYQIETRKLLSSNPGIEHLHLIHLSSPDVLNQITATCVRLTELRLVLMSFEIADVVKLLRTCDRLHKVSFEGCDINCPDDRLLDDTSANFPSIEILEFELNPEPGLPFLIEWASHCPQLKSLKFSKVPYTEGEGRRDYALLGQCTRLSKIILDSIYLQEDELADLWRYCPRLTDIVLEGQEVRPRSFEVLTQAGIFVNLRSFITSSFVTMYHGMLFQVLQSCPKLVEFSVVTSCIDDILDTPISPTGQLSWACTGLKVFKVKRLIWSLDAEVGDRVLNELVALKELEVLVFENIYEDDDRPYRRKIIERRTNTVERNEIQEGLVKLFKKKGVFTRFALEQDNVMRWMNDSWPKLKRFTYGKIVESKE